MFGGWRWFRALSFTNSRRKGHLETGAGLKFFSSPILEEKLVWRLELVRSSFLHKSFKKSSFGGCRWSEAFSFINPLRKARQSFHRINCSAWNTRTLILHITRTLPRPIQAVAIHWGPDPTLSRFVTSTVNLENIAILMQNSQTCVLICFSIVV